MDALPFSFHSIARQVSGCQQRTLTSGLGIAQPDDSLDGTLLFTMTNFESKLRRLAQIQEVTIRSASILATTAKTRSVTAHVPEQRAQKVDLMAERLERSKNWIVKQALLAWIDQEEERSRLTREALADVDAGRVIDHQAVQAWADSLSTDSPLPVPR